MTDSRDLALRLPVHGIQLIEASAGTGKTFTVASLYARLVIEFALPVSQLLAVTFTEAATRELREKLRQRLVEARDALETADADEDFAPRASDSGEAALTRALLANALLTESRAALRHRLRQAVQQMDLAPIHTIHGFCHRALHDHALAAGLPLEARELLRNDSALRHEVALEFWRDHSRSPAEAEALLAIWKSPAKLAASLRDWQSVDALLPLAPPDDDGAAEAALREARAVLAQAYAEHGDSARELLRQAFANKVISATYSKDEAVNAVWQALRDWHADPRDSDPDHKNVDWYGSDHLRTKTNQDKKTKQRLPTPESPLFDAIGAWVRARDAAKASLRARCIAMAQAARTFARRRMGEHKHLRRQIGFDDMIEGVHAALQGEQGLDFARALRGQYAIALVDEFQDTDPRQWAIFRQLFAEADLEDGNTPRALFLIGDPKQAIYRFRGGDLNTYLDAQQAASGRHALLRNFRSRPLALAAVQALFEFGGDRAFTQEGIEFEAVEAGGTCPDDALLVDGRPAPGLIVQRVEPNEDEGDKADAMRDQATAACVASIHALLTKSARGNVEILDKQGRRRALGPGDISVLVARNQDGERVQQALSALGIPSVAAGRSSLYQTEEALHLCWLLEALLAPADDGRLRAVLASPLFGLDAAALANLDEDLAEHRTWQDRLRVFLQRAQAHGPMALVGDICAEQSPRLLSLPDGERRLSNYLQLAEELQTGAALGLSGLLSELGRRIEDADGENESELLRLESDAARVRIMTLHVSKGLTLDLVFLPYAALTPTKAHASQPPMARLHQGLQRVGWLYPESGSDEQKEELHESRAELIRLLYVGLTRARLATWVGWGAVKKANETALAWLLHRAPDSEEIGKLDAESVSARLREFKKQAGAAVEIQAAVSPSLLESLPRLHFIDGAAPPPVRVAKRKLDRDWWVYSFSHLAREDSGAEAGGAWDEIEGAPLQRSRFSGSRFGNVLHQALEKIDFAAWRDWRDELPPSGQLEALQQALSDHGYASEADQFEGLPLLTTLVAETLNTAMPEGVRLSALEEHARRAEMEFHLALAPVQISAMLDLLHRYGVVDERTAFGKRQRLEGLLTGRIDLIYEAQGRYYVLDYKSNQLPDYGPESVARAIAEGEYDLQYLIYTLALHRWLRFRLGRAYDMGQHLGGVRYLFCRGLDRDDAARPGVHALRLPDALILELDALLELAGAAA